MDQCLWVDCEQGSEEWHKARCGKVTASRFSDVMTNGRAGQPSKTVESYMMSLIAENLTNQPVDEIHAKSLDWGKKYEADARATYTLITGLGVAQVGFAIHPSMPYVGASVDGLVGNSGLVEFKCPYNSTVHLTNMLSGRVPKEYVAQVQGQLWITGRAWCDFVSYDPRMPESHQCVIVRELRDEKIISEIESRVESFLGNLAEMTEKINDSAKRSSRS